MKKVLIYFPENQLKPVGGPAGYLYNLKSELACPDIQIDFLYSQNGNSKRHNWAKKNVPIRIQSFIRALKYTRLHSQYSKQVVDIHQYDAIHFHSTEALFMCRNKLSDYHGKVILTSHTPCASFQEKLARLNALDAKLLRKKLNYLKEIDRYAFERADKIVFPCEEAEEPYYHTWSEYAQIRKPSKYLYMPTGIKPCFPKVSRKEIREMYGVPQNAFVACFVGRHNEIKGYDALRRIAKQLTHRDVWFLIAGAEYPLKRLEDKKWIEVGWTNDPHSIISAADIFILPNKETYFDLVMLEVLSLGKTVLASFTGGNKYFCQFESGVIFYETENQAVEKLEALKQLPKESLDELGIKNKLLFDKYFSIKSFADRYETILETILLEDNEGEHI